ncbi:MAG: aminomethyl-transferring glycine dehydrogenase [Thermoanaerobaculia bacterium]|nr:aminomethyl-transferring glycine dehydrogenase [Thermoanaerobaculia bacterium]
MTTFLDRPNDPFPPRHLGPRGAEVEEMLARLGCGSLEELVASVIPNSIRSDRPLALPPGDGERRELRRLADIAGRNQVWRSYLGMGYSGTVTPAVIARNVLSNPGWYTQYTPYQAEISQGRLEALLNFQTMISELTGLPLANASLLDEATAAAEAMAICRAAAGVEEGGVFYAAEDCHPQTLAVLRGRAAPLGITVATGPATVDAVRPHAPFGALVQYPGTWGDVEAHDELAHALEEAGSALVVAADPLALTLLRPPGEFGAALAVGSTQRLGVPLGYGGPHAAYLAAAESFERLLPGRIVGVSRDAEGRDGYRLARQTREQHIRRERATSNICTAQVLPAILAAMYGVYHGPAGLTRIARRIAASTRVLAAGLTELGAAPQAAPLFDTVRVRLEPETAGAVLAAARERSINLRDGGDGSIAVSLDETVERTDLDDLLDAFAAGLGVARGRSLDELARGAEVEIPAAHRRASAFMTQEVFARYHSEHDLLRYLFRLQERDLSLAHSMIPLGSCTMKLNATAEMMPITWPELADLHPFAPPEQAAGYAELFRQLEEWLAEITGFPAVSLQPNAGSQGEYSGLLVIRAYHAERGEGERDVCLIPTSAHGTNPASAVMAGLRVVPVDCDDRGNVDFEDLERKCERHAERLAALMITYPSTHGVFEERVRDICDAVHRRGGQVYLDGANMNAQVGLCRPAEYGADVCHLNLHKTFCIPHGGGGPGMGPICAADHLAPFLPGHPLAATGGDRAIPPVAAAPWGSPGILPISWMYIAMMGAEGLTRASQIAILNANYMASRLKDHFPILYTGRNGRVAHEFVIDLRGFRKSAGITVDDVAKRLMDYGFHAPTMSWPVPGTMMIEPTESESQQELDRFCDAMIAIRAEIREIETGAADRRDNLLVNAPHPAARLTADEWPHPYSRRRAAYPAPWLRERKFWPPTARIDNAWGDRHLVCTCDPVASYAEADDEAPALVG